MLPGWFREFWILLDGREIQPIPPCPRRSACSTLNLAIVLRCFPIYLLARDQDIRRSHRLAHSNGDPGPLVERSGKGFPRVALNLERASPLREAWEEAGVEPKSRSGPREMVRQTNRDQVVHFHGGSPSIVERMAGSFATTSWSSEDAIREVHRFSGLEPDPLTRHEPQVGRLTMMPKRGVPTRTHQR